MKKRFGQHFLHDRNILQKLVHFARVGADDFVVEIGPGAGALTTHLAATVRHVLAIEIDTDLIPGLRRLSLSNVEIIEGDALDVEFPAEPFDMVGNLPYNVATPLIKRFIAHRSRIRAVTAMLQKEVALRMMASPSTAEYGPLSIMVQYYADVTYGFSVPPEAFRPRPKVDSAVVRLDWKPDVPDARGFTDFVHRAFGSRRKKLANNLLRIFNTVSRENVVQKLTAAGVRGDCRPEELSVPEFLRVYNQFQ